MRQQLRTHSRPFLIITLPYFCVQASHGNHGSPDSWSMWIRFATDQAWYRQEAFCHW